jgi:NAD(P)-dependent dehydrogenase (short-subunit alcohol dehydrogenase family)
MNRLDGKVAVVTGGSSGIGFATAQRFVEEGAFVFITGRRRPELDKAKDEIGRNVATVQGDVSVSADLDRLFRTVAEDKGKIDVVVANSGLVDPQMFGRITEASFDRTFNVNARGALFTAQKALPLMNDGGSVILVGSIAGHIGVEGYTTYSATGSTSSVPARSTPRSWTARRTPRKASTRSRRPSHPSSRSDAWDVPRKSPRPPSSSHPTRAASAQAWN